MGSVELIAVGTELLLGQLLDTNTKFIEERLAENGIDVRATHVVGDNRERIAAAIESALGRSDGAITTGGLGPTVDDLTKEGVCEALGLGVELYEPALQQMASSPLWAARCAPTTESRQSCRAEAARYPIRMGRRRASSFSPPTENSW